MLVNNIISLAARQVGDPDFSRPKSQYADWVDAAIREYVNMKPDAYAVRGVYRLSPGIVQRLPDGGDGFVDPGGDTLPEALQLIAFGRNMGTDGNTPGNWIRIADIEQMTVSVLGWGAASGVSQVESAFYDLKDPFRFSVYPPQPETGCGWIEVIYGAVPPPITRNQDGGPADDAVLPLPSVCANAVIYYICHMAMLADGGDENSLSLAERYLHAFEASVVRRDAREELDAPNNNSKKG